jgi:RNA polymerase sigma-70 factor, ECF subfamily
MLTYTVAEYAFSATSHAERNNGLRANSPCARDPRGTSDETLIEQIARGDRAAMHMLYARHSPSIYRFILRLTENRSTAEDLLSDVFLDVWRSAADFQRRSRVSTWLLAIARHKALSALRRRLHEPLDEQLAEATEDPADDPEMAAHKTGRSAIVRKCLTRLSRAHREVLDLVYYHEKSVDEVAQILGVPRNTVKTRMFYARTKMAGLLKDASLDG